MKKLILTIMCAVCLHTLQAQTKMPDSVFVKVRNIVTIGTPAEVSAEAKKRQYIKANYEVLGYQFIKLMQNPKNKPEGLYMLLIYRYAK